MYKIRPKFLFVMISLALFILSFNDVSAQSTKRRREKNDATKTIVEKIDSLQKNLEDSTLVNKVDSLIVNQIDSSSLLNADSLNRVVLDSLQRHREDSLLRSKSMLDFPVFSSAKDSIIEDFSGKEKYIYYYGGVTVTYGDMKITSDYMAYNIDTKTVYASGITDTLGNTKGSPVMTQGSKSYDMENVYYNFGSRKAKIRNMKTKEEEGFLHGDYLKMMPDQSINVSKGKYTVCDLDHPHYYLRMTAAKVVTKPKQRTVFGPAYLVVEDVPLPLAVPFGFVPANPKRSSGILFPTYGEEVSRGFYLKDMGYYFVFGDHFDVALTGDLYSLGSWSVKLNSRYKLRYKFNGSLALSYSNDQTGERGSTDFFKSTNFGVQWSHSQDPKSMPGASFRASVNFSSPSNNKYNSHDINNAIQSQASSSISYSKTWSKMSLSVNALHSQNSRDSSYSFTLPNITFNVNRFFPFKRKNRIGKEKFYEQLSLSYNTSFQNRINFKASEVSNPDFWNKMQNGMNHRFNIGLPSFTLLKYLNFSPGVNYGMNWYFQDMSKKYNEETDRVEDVKSDMFSTFGVTQDFSASLSMSTRIYGMFNFRRGSLKAIRHMITPSVSFSYKPEMGTPINGFRTYTYVDKDGNEQSVDYNRFQGGLNSPPSKGQTAGLSFQIGNNLEAKMIDKKDTTGTGTKKVKLLDQLSIRGSYNFLADSMKLSTIGISANTTIFKKMGLSGSITLDPYAVDDRGRRYNTYNIVKQGGVNLFRLTNASFSTSYTFSGKGKIDGNDGANAKGAGQPGGPGGYEGRGENGSSSGHSGAEEALYHRVYYHPVTGEFIPGGWLYYLNPSSPWSVTLSYSYSFNRSYQYANDRLNVKNNHMQTLQISGQVKITKDLNINAQSGIDLTKMKITTTQISATYDLHCFAISFSWVPMGQWKSWNFRINAKASALSDLLQFKKNASYWDN